MIYLTSRRLVLPNTAAGMRDWGWFNMWTRQQWPYEALVKGDTLYWYESPTKTVCWKSRVKRVARFRYSSKKEAAREFADFFKGFDRHDQAQDYFVDAPSTGYGLAYKLSAVAPVEPPVSRPKGMRLPMLGWLKEDEIAEIWPGLV